MGAKRVCTVGARPLRRRDDHKRWVGPRSSSWTLCAPNGKLYLSYRPFKGMQLRAVELTRSIPGGRAVGSYPSLEEDVKRRQPTSPSAVKRPMADTLSVMFGGVPTILEHLATTAYDDGSPRKTGELRVRMEGLLYAVQLTCVDTRTFFSVTAPLIDDAISAAALLAACDDCPWEPAHWLMPNAKKKSA